MNTPFYAIEVCEGKIACLLCFMHAVRTHLRCQKTLILTRKCINLFEIQTERTLLDIPEIKGVSPYNGYSYFQCQTFEHAVVGLRGLVCTFLHSKPKI